MSEEEHEAAKQKHYAIIALAYRVAILDDAVTAAFLGKEEDSQMSYLTQERVDAVNALEAFIKGQAAAS